MCGTQQEGWRFPGGSQEAPVRRYASKIPPFCEEAFWILCPNCKPWHSRRESANFDRGGGLCCRQVVQVWTGAGWVLRGGFPPGPGRGARGGTAYPLGGRGSSEASRRSAPLPRLPGGGPHFSREMGRKRAGAPPLDPTFYSRSLPLAGFWDRYPWYDSGTTSSGMLRPIWDAFSSKKYAEKAFL